MIVAVVVQWQRPESRLLLPPVPSYPSLLIFFLGHTIHSQHLFLPSRVQTSLFDKHVFVRGNNDDIAFLLHSSVSPFHRQLSILPKSISIVPLLASRIQQADTIGLVIIHVRGEVFSQAFSSNFGCNGILRQRVRFSELQRVLTKQLDTRSVQTLPLT